MTNTPKAAPVRAKDCPLCAGRGVRALGFGMQHCDECGGTGKYIPERLTAAENEGDPKADRYRTHESLQDSSPSGRVTDDVRYVRDGDPPLLEYAKRIAATIDEQEKDDRRLVAWATIKHWRMLLRRGIEAAVTVAGGEEVPQVPLSELRGILKDAYDDPNPVQPVAEAGYVLVPKEPTEEMLARGAAHLRPYYPINQESARHLMEDMRDGWHEMIETAATRGGEES